MPELPDIEAYLAALRPLTAGTRLAARGRSPVGRATRTYGAYARREEDAMLGHRTSAIT